MANYVWSTANRFYVGTESSYGSPALIGAANRLQAAHLQCHQGLQVSRRRDKTGARTYLGGVTNGRRLSNFALNTHLTSWDLATAPSYGLVIQAALGAPPELVSGLTVAAANGMHIQTQLPHNLSLGSAISSDGEIRFVIALESASTLTLNVPFSNSPGAGDSLAKTIVYRLATPLPSLSLYDYWDPPNAVSRLITGAGVDTFQLQVKGDTHTLDFSGPAGDVLDSCSAAFGISGVGSFPPEPPFFPINYSIVAGQLGQVWLGAPLVQFFTLMEARVTVKNNLLVRDREYGSPYPRAIVPGVREVTTSFTVFAQDDTATRNLYAAAKNRTPVSAMLQLGRQPGQIMAVYLPAVIPELPLYDDSETDLLWQFNSCVARGVIDNEAFVAFS